ncbi:Hypothetical predicted protein [Lynx pardinus]|uniref:Uncharacterized protein n=1 Tax=Lynx pardinus TaxID=191816 RepID=A0A485PEN1_LYNPA|nr:Hypothetical predicted protein [Lynx pardinus]
MPRRYRLLIESSACLRTLRWQQRLTMAQCVSLLVFLHGVLAFQTKGVLGLSEESSDSSRGYKKSYYIFQMLPIQNLKGRPENAFDRKAADPPALWPSSVLGARDVIRPAVSPVASVRLRPVPVTPRQNPSTVAPRWLGSTALRGPVPTPFTQARIPQTKGLASVPRNRGTHFSVSARFPPTPRVLTTAGLPTNGALHGTSVPTSPTTKEPRGDM